MVALPVVFAISLFMQAGSPIVTPPQNVTVRSEVVLQAPPPDPEAIADASTTSYQAIVVQLFAPMATNLVNDWINHVPDFIRSTPANLSYEHSAVRGMTNQILVVSAAMSLLAALTIGFSIMLGRGDWTALGRLIFAAVLSLGDLVWWQIGIDLNNAITSGIDAPPVADIVKPHLTIPTIPTLSADPVAAFGPAVMVIVYAVVVLLLLISMAFRLGLIDILIVIGPLALMCAATDQSRPFFDRYIGLATGTLFSQILVVVALRLAPVLGVLTSGVSGAILGIVVLLLARQMPSMLGNATRGSAAGAGMLLLLRRAVLRR